MAELTKDRYRKLLIKERKILEDIRENEEIIKDLAKVLFIF